jgi:hypothetical protein
MPNQTQEVDEFLDNLSHPLREGVIATRAAILASDEQITEHIKWNAPSFCYRGDDRVTFRLHPADRFQIVFHRGAKVREDSGDFVFEDDSGLLRFPSWLAMKGSDKSTRDRPTGPNHRRLPGFSIGKMGFLYTDAFGGCLSAQFSSRTLPYGGDTGWATSSQENVHVTRRAVRSFAGLGAIEPELICGRARRAHCSWCGQVPRASRTAPTRCTGCEP